MTLAVGAIASRSGSELGRGISKWEHALSRHMLLQESQIADLWAQSFKEIQKEQSKFLQYVEQQRALGKISPYWAFRDQRYQSLLGQVSNTLKSFSSAALRVVAANNAEAVALALTHTQTDVNEALGRAPTGIQAAELFGPEWSKINKTAFQTMAGFLSSQEAPLNQLFQTMHFNASAVYRQNLLRGIVLGQSPRRIASNIAQALGKSALGRARTIARTEFHRTYREAKVTQWDDIDVIKDWIWKAKLDAYTCAICWSQHGTRHPKNEVMASHPNCRCVMLPNTKLWSELGFPGVRETGARADLRAGAGANAFKALDPARQRRMLGKTRFAEYLGGKPLSSFFEKVNHPKWGPSYRFIKLPPGSFPKALPKGVTYAEWDKAILRNEFALHNAGVATQQMLQEAFGIVNINNISPGHIFNAIQTSVTRYMGALYRELNQMLRGVIPFDAHLQGHVDKLDDMFRNARGIPQDMVVYRGMGTSGTGKIYVGKSWLDKGFMSTSSDANVSQGFGASREQVFLHIRVPKGYKAVALDVVAGGPYGEKEILLPRGVRLVAVRQLPSIKSYSGYEVPVFEVEIIP